jgi:hypothetical protein
VHFHCPVVSQLQGGNHLGLVTPCDKAHLIVLVFKRLLHRHVFACAAVVLKADDGGIHDAMLLLKNPGIFRRRAILTPGIL